MSRWLCCALFALVLAPAQARASGFSTSFEAGDPQPAPALDRQSGVTGGTQAAVTAATASADNPPNETAPKAFDGSPDTKWLTFASTGWLQAQLAQPTAVVAYSLTSGNDAPGRDPRDWTLAGSDDGSSWTTVDTQTGQDFSARGQTKSYSVANTTAYAYYRLTVTANHGENIVQLAELTLNGATAAPGMRAAVDSGPTAGPNVKPNVGFSGLKALHYSGEQAAGHGYAYTKLFDLDLPVARGDQLSYELFPQLLGDLHYPSTYSGVDVKFSDGTTLSDHGVKQLWPDQWNHRTVDLLPYAGKTIAALEIGYDNPNGPAKFSGWLDDLQIRPAPAQPDDPAGWAITTRGTNSSGSFSRGNNIPATAMPHGFNFWTPETDANSLDWVYDYAKANNADNLPTLQAFGLSHEPSPWMGDRQTFQVMPSLTTNTSRSARALPFHHANEVAHPDYYGVTFDDGIKGEIAPTDHAAAMRFSFPAGNATLIFDNVDNGTATLSIDQAHSAITAVSDTNGANGATPMYIYATFDRPMTASATTRDRTGWATFDGSTVTMRIATSLISPAQAQRNLALEIAPTDTFDSVHARAHAAWNQQLGVIDVQGATPDQQTTLYSNLYRLNLYPNSGYEDTPDGIRHMIQSPLVDPKVVPGKVYVNNGFWDTYRTAWPAYALLYPKQAGELVDGFVQEYRDTGWISRWSSPGAANLMTGTSSDVAFADAYLRGVRGFNAEDAYRAALKDATVAPPGNPFDSDVGRKGLVQSIFLGYTPNSVTEGLSWALEGYVNDYGIGNLAAALGHTEEAKYFLSRSQGYTRLFDPGVGFFQGKSAAGDWTTPDDQFDPRVWRQNGDYTETDGWNFAFHAPQDGQGLADLYGGKAQLAAKLDQFFSTPETAQFPGTYGGTIHEMLEARDVRMGQWGASNQVSHHIPYMYDYAGEPYKTQALVREATGRLFTGSDIGEGYPGDEDNGEMSAWWIFSALGFYPLQAGSPNWAIGSPLFTRAVVHMGDGHDLVIKAPNNSASNVYVQGLKIDGAPTDRTWFSQAEIARGGTLEFDMGPSPSRYGVKSPPPSLTQGAKAPYPLTDAAALSEGEPSARALFDDDSRTTATAQSVTFSLDRERHISYYTLTSAPSGTDPSAWTVEGSTDGTHWRLLDERRGQTFPWRPQTRPFALRDGGADVSRVRIDFAGPPVALGEVEFLSDKAVPPSPLSLRAGTAVGRAGEEVTIPVTATDTRKRPPACTLTATAFGETFTGSCTSVPVTIPAGTTPGSYTVELVAHAGDATARAEASITVYGDTIAFTPGTDAETPWLFETGGSQLDGAIYDGHGRFADGTAHFTYRFPVPAGTTQAKLTLELGNEFVVDVSPDNSTWKEVLREPTQEHDQRNYGPRELTVDTSGSWLYVKVGDAFPSDGWGGWLGKLTLTY